MDKVERDEASPGRTGPTVDRRQFLGLSLAAAPALALSGCGGGGSASSASAGGSYRPTFFSAAEWAFLQAAVARLIPADARGPGALEAGVPEYIDRQMATPWAAGRRWYMQGPFQPDAPATLGWQSRLVPREVYRLGIADAEHWTRARHGQAFAALSADLQDQALRAFEAGTAGFAQVPAKAFFALLLANTREGFFCDPRHGGNHGLASWKLIGFPGARADFMDWVERDAAYPLPPVSIDGQRG